MDFAHGEGTDSSAFVGGEGLAEDSPGDFSVVEIDGFHESVAGGGAVGETGDFEVVGEDDGGVFCQVFEGVEHGGLIFVGGAFVEATEEGGGCESVEVDFPGVEEVAFCGVVGDGGEEIALAVGSSIAASVSPDYESVSW